MGGTDIKGKRVLLILSILASLLSASNAFALSTSTSANVTVTVSKVFNLSVDTSTVDFGNVMPGVWKEVTATGLAYANELVCKSNTGSPWSLKIKASGPLSFGSNLIPLNNMKWLSTFAGNKNAPYDDFSAGLNHPAAGGYVDFTTLDETVYSSGNFDSSNLPNGTGVLFKYGIFIPDNVSQSAGTYTTFVTYTMTE